MPRRGRRCTARLSSSTLSSDAASSRHASAEACPFARRHLRGALQHRGAPHLVAGLEQQAGGVVSQHIGHAAGAARDQRDPERGSLHQHVGQAVVERRDRDPVARGVPREQLVAVEEREQRVRDRAVVLTQPLVHVRLEPAGEQQMKALGGSGAGERLEQEHPALLRLELTEQADRLNAVGHRLPPPRGGAPLVARSEGPVRAVDPVWDPAHGDARVQRGDLVDLVLRYRADHRRAGERVVEDRAAPGGEHRGVEIVAADERDQRHAEPRRVDRAGDQRPGPTERDDVGHISGRRIGLERRPGPIERVRRVVLDRADQVAAAGLDLDRPRPARGGAG